MTKEPSIRAALLGCGLMARHHVTHILQHFPKTEFPVVCDPSEEAYAEMSKIFQRAGRDVPPNEPILEKLLNDFAKNLDAVFIITPHAVHHDQAKACLEADLDVLLEKPMVMTAHEARSLIEVRDNTQKHLVVAFQGSLSQEVRKATRMLQSGELGTVLNINASIWQNWATLSDGTWRQQLEHSGGGFLFDSGAHMLNTVSDLAGKDFEEVCAWTDRQGRTVEILAAVIGRLKSGALVTLTGCGNTIPSCASDIRVFCTKGILRTGAWGKFLEVQLEGRDRLEPVPVPKSRGVWEQFQLVRAGEIENPSPPEVGLRMAGLWDAIQASARRGGAPVEV